MVYKSHAQEAQAVRNESNLTLYSPKLTFVWVCHSDEKLSANMLSYVFSRYSIFRGGRIYIMGRKKDSSSARSNSKLEMSLLQTVQIGLNHIYNSDASKKSRNKAIYI